MSALAVVPPPPASSATLYEMVDDLAALLASVEMTEAGSQERAECEAAIARYYEELTPAKVDATARRLRHWASQVQLAKAEEERLYARRQAFQREIERLEQYCIRALRLLPAPKKGPRKLEGQFSTLSLRASEGVVVTAEESVPAEYKTAAVKLPLPLWAAVADAVKATAAADVAAAVAALHVETAVSREAVKQALKAGTEVPGADLEFRDHLKVG
jgi:hypothetical protein